MSSDTAPDGPRFVSAQEFAHDFFNSVATDATLGLLSWPKRAMGAVHERRDSTFHVEYLEGEKWMRDTGHPTIASARRQAAGMLADGFKDIPVRVVRVERTVTTFVVPTEEP